MAILNRHFWDDIWKKSKGREWIMPPSGERGAGSTNAKSQDRGEPCNNLATGKKPEQQKYYEPGVSCLREEFREVAGI